MPTKRKSSSTGKRLTAGEKRTIVGAARKAYRLFGSSLTAEKRDEIFATVQAMKSDRKPIIGKEAIALWAAKVDYAVANGDKLKIGKLLKSPASGLEMAPLKNSAAMKSAQTRFYDSNGGCSCGGDPTTLSW